MGKKSAISVAIISKNEEKNLRKLLEVISEFAEEIVLVDSGSTDNTLKISEEYKCEIFHRDWTNFTEQKNFALSKCKNDWILSLDCDEIPDNQLIKNILNIVENQRIGAYKLKRKTVYLGKMMNYSWQPDEQLRLVHQSVMPEWTGDFVHESIKVNSKIETIDGFLHHYSYSDIKHHFIKTVYYSELSAKEYLKKGKKPIIFNLILNPIYAFISMYLFKLGLLDGWRGLIAAFSSMTGTFLKYAQLFELYNNQKSK